MPAWARVALVAAGIFLVNVPLGRWRAGVRKFSWRWFVAVHAAVPVAVGLRMVAGVRFRWALVPVFVGAYFAGQVVGARSGRRA
jgi:hypothetical protein